MQGTEAINGLVTSIDVPADKDSGKYKINFTRYTPEAKGGVKDSEEFDLIIGSDGANSRVAKVIDVLFFTCRYFAGSETG